MSAIHVVVRPHAKPRGAPAPSIPAGLFDVVVDGVNVTARIGEGQALALLAELAHIVADLVTGRRTRATLRLYTESEAWELGLEVDGHDALLTVYRAAPSAEVAVHERRVRLLALRDGVVAALADVDTRHCLPTLGASLASASDVLRSAAFAGPASARSCRPMQLSSGADERLTLSARAKFRQVPAADPRPGDLQLERTDLHALLTKGVLSVESRGRTVTVPGVYLLLAVERLLALGAEALDASEQARPLFRRVQVGQLRIGLRRGPGDGPLAFTLGRASQDSDSPPLTFPELPASVFVTASAELALALAGAFVKGDPGQSRNLRLGKMIDLANGLLERTEARKTVESITNPEPEAYRTYAPPSRRDESRGRWEHGAKMRFLPRWVATVPHIDLRGTLLCEERIFVGTYRELVCLTRDSGEVVWRSASARAGTVVTASGLARVFADGRVTMHDLETGLVRFSARLVPRSAGGATGAVVHTPGLPKLLVMAEGERQITALDLVSGEIRWRHTARAPGSFRVRRAGKLLIVAGGDSTMVALDATTGDVVWRHCERLPFTGDLVVDADAVLAVSGSPQGPSWLHRIDVWTGKHVWAAPLEGRPPSGQPPLVSDQVIVMPVRDARGIGAVGVRRATGEVAWQHAVGVSARTAAWITIGDGIVANTAEGTLVCLDAATGSTRFSHVFSRQVEADQPRRLEPVLRSGALFVPQHQVYVLRPRDGEIIGAVPGDLVPDWVRVDEGCGVYVAEESGHLSAFAAAAQLTRVK